MSQSILNRINSTVEQMVEEEDINFNEASAGGGGRLLPEGKALGRLIRYIELGPQLNKNYPEKAPTNIFFLEFAIWGKAKNGETYHTVEGDKMIPGIVKSRRITVSTSLTTKSNAFKLFKRMCPLKDAKHFAQLINRTFILPIVHNESGEGDKKKTYANIDLENIMLAVDPVTDQPYNVPQVEDESMYKVFLWNRPTKEDWESLYIEGKNDEGKSKNWIQDTILESPLYPGSPLDVLLNGSAAGSSISELPDVGGEDEPAKEPEPQAEELEVSEDNKEPDVTGEADFGLPSL